MEAQDMLDPDLRDRVNEVLERLFALDDTVANACAFRSLLEDLHRRDLTIVREPHVAAIHNGILRSALGTAMACLDPADRRGNRASIGQLLDLLGKTDIVDTLRQGSVTAASQAASLAQIRTDYDALTASEVFTSGRRLRNEGIAHTLLESTPTPTVSYETIYRLHDEAERLTARLFEVCCRKPGFDGHHSALEASAKVFWDTYFQGMQVALPAQ